MARSDALLDYLGEQFGGINDRLAELQEGFDSLQTAVDGYAKRTDGYFQ